MASEQSRRDNTTTERDVQLEKDRVPKVTAHFESLSTIEKPQDSEILQAKARESNEGGPQLESLSDKVKGEGGGYSVGKFEAIGNQEEKDTDSKEAEKGDRKSPDQLSLEEITKLRQTAQQNSMEALKGAQERYEQAKEKASQGLGAAAEYTKEKGEQAKDTVAEGAQRTSEQMVEKGSQAKDAVVEGARNTGQYVAEKSALAKDTVLEGAQRTSQYVTEKGREAKDTAVEKGQQGYEATKDTVVGAGKSAKDYAMETAAAAKDVTVERSKEAAHYAGEVAVDVKDRAAVTGWTAAHYTTEKAVEGTKAAAGAVQVATGKAAELAAKPFTAAKLAAVSTGESMKEYTAMKKEEAERELEARKASEKQGGDYKEESQVHATGETQANPTESISEKVFPESSKEQQQQGGGAGGSVLGAIGETIVEIAQATKEFVIGQGQPRTQESSFKSCEEPRTQNSKQAGYDS